MRQWNDGVTRVFVIGTDDAVWNIVRKANGDVSGWKSLGGVVRGDVYFSSAAASNNFTIWTTGSNYLPYCKSFDGNWSNWYRC